MKEKAFQEQTGAWRIVTYKERTPSFPLQPSPPISEACRKGEHPILTLQSPLFYRLHILCLDSVSLQSPASETQMYDLEEGCPDAQETAGRDASPLLVPLLPLLQSCWHLCCSEHATTLSPQSLYSLFPRPTMLCPHVSSGLMPSSPSGLCSHVTSSARSSRTTLFQSHINSQHSPPFWLYFYPLPFRHLTDYVVHICLFIVLSPLLACKLDYLFVIVLFMSLSSTRRVPCT